MAYLQIFVLAVVTGCALGCSTDADCSSTSCNHGEYGACERVHGSGGGNGEFQCVCKHHRRSARATVCTSTQDCPPCGHGEHATCEIAHGQGGGSGEMQCGCAHGGKRLISATQVCMVDGDCDKWASTECGHRGATCELVHGSGVGGGEMNCQCKAHKKRATGCCNADDCDANALGCTHQQVASCELLHGSGGQCSENTCKCVSKHH